MRHFGQRSRFESDVALCCRYDFDSWREFSYLDEENKEKAEW